MKEEKTIGKKDIEKLLAEGENVQAPVNGYSMSPLLTPGRDFVLLTPYTGQQLKKHDVILFRRINDRLILHRIHKINDDRVYCIGDNQVQIEGPLELDQIKGVAYGFIRNGKTISTDSISYRLSSFLWTLTRPVRPLIHKTVSTYKKLFNISR